MTDIPDNRPSLPTRQEIIDACATLHNTNTLKYEVDGARPLFIKFGYELMGGAETQKYLYEQSMRDPSAPRLPAVYDSFESGGLGWRRGYIVMEYIEAPTVEYWLEHKPDMAELLYDKVTEAVRWILDCPLPAEPRFGPVGRGPAHHHAFADLIAPLEFDSVEAVQRYFNAALTRFTPKRVTPLSVDFSNEEVCFYHSDIRPANFHYDPETQKITIVDLDHVGMGPKSFASWPFHAVHHVDYEFRRIIATRINYELTENISGMARASGYLIMCSNPTLGLDNSGHRKPKPLPDSKMISAEKLV
ncbi:hypothetical protein FRC01_007778 [Tulasnella sp. 417]|nr:hypothetical protein FRC01_007778 [Tulasnella sp. 417]